ncbi:MAG: hypothetical protein AB7F89_07275 [Pirellulaceae bacterium]
MAVSLGYGGRTGRWIGCAAIWLSVCVAGDTPDRSQAGVAALHGFQSYIGQWRGVGQPRRGSNKDAWTEQCQWRWRFADGGASLILQSDNGRYVRSAEFTAGQQAGQYVFTATGPNGERSRYTGTIAGDGRLVLQPAASGGSLPDRVSMRMVADGDRLLVLYERKQPGGVFTRLAEVGFTREGSQFGKGAGYVECIVTGGLGTMPVSHEGHTYQVCCTGCRDYFLEEPEKVLAQYRAKKQSERSP